MSDSNSSTRRLRALAPDIVKRIRPGRVEKIARALDVAVPLASPDVVATSWLLNNEKLNSPDWIGGPRNEVETEVLRGGVVLDGGKDDLRKMSGAEKLDWINLRPWLK